MIAHNMVQFLPSLLLNKNLYIISGDSLLQRLYSKSYHY